jgi:hypothetical protein
MKLPIRKLHKPDVQADVTLYNSWLFPILNGDFPPRHSTSASCQRLRQLLSALQELEALRMSLGPHIYELWVGSLKGVSEGISATEDAPDRRFQRLAQRINAALRSYRWFPQLAFDPDGSMRRLETFDERTEAYYHENLAVAIFLRELLEGRIDRFRSCLVCDRWFYAMTSHQKYCSSNCRMKDHSQSAQFKAKRARYMREKYRPFIKKLERQAKREAAR